MRKIKIAAWQSLILLIAALSLLMALNRNIGLKKIDYNHALASGDMEQAAELKALIDKGEKRYNNIRGPLFIISGIPLAFSVLFYKEDEIL
ncbi:MAG: hypothetical protein GX025_09965 [Clostridiales bacterium]|nr:hypothetical protein [Clostridiales bacterium]